MRPETFAAAVQMLFAQVNCSELFSKATKSLVNQHKPIDYMKLVSFDC